VVKSFLSYELLLFASTTYTQSVKPGHVKYDSNNYSVVK
jgi:hypothetical protein